MEEELINKKDIKKKKNILTLSILSTIVILLGSAYAFFTYFKSAEAFTLTSNQITASFTEGTNQISFTNAYPISDEFALENLSKLDYIDFTVSGNAINSKEAVTYEIFLTEANGNTLSNNYIKTYVTDENGGKVTDPTMYGSLPQTTYGNEPTGKVIYKDRRKGQFSRSYRLYCWLDKDFEDNSISRNFSFYINLYAYNDTSEGLVTVTFDYNDGVTQSTTKQVNYGESYGELPTPTRSGYTFMGWNGKNLLLPQTNDSLVWQNTTISVENNKYILNGNPPENWSAGEKTFNLLNFHEDANYPVYLYRIGNLTTMQLPAGEYILSINKISGNIPPYLCRVGVLKYFSDSIGTVITQIDLSQKQNVTKFTLLEETEVLFFLSFETNEQILDNISFYVQLQTGTEATEYEPSYITSDTKVVQNQDHTLKAIWKEDNESPTLSLSKETYFTENFNNCNLTNATVTNGIVSLNTATSSVNCGYYDVNYGKWYTTYDGFTTSSSEKHDPGAGSAGVGSGGINTASIYYDEQYNETQAANGNYSNGNSPSLPLNTWSNNFRFEYSGSNNVKYLRIKFSTGNDYSQPTTKIRNLKIYGDAIPNDFYLINITSSDNYGVTETKYAKGNQNAEYFRSNGINVTNNQVRVTENGTYTIYVRDEAGNETIDTIEISNIV